MKKLAQLRVNSSCLPVIESTKDHSSLLLRQEAPLPGVS